MRAEQSTFPLVSLSEIVDINIGKTPARKEASFWGGEHTWVSIADLNCGKYISKTKEGITDEGIAKSGIKLVPEGTILFSFKLSIGKVAITKKPLYTNEAIAALPIKDTSKIDKNYLYFTLRELNFSDSGERAAMGRTLNKAKLKNLKIPLPSLAVQKKIALILSVADSLREKDIKTLSHYKRLAESLFLDMFGDPVLNTKNWKIGSFGDYIDILTDYHANGSYEVLKKNVELRTEKDFALMIRTTDLEKGIYNKDVIYISESAYHYLDKSKVFGGEIIINKIGSAGNVYLMPHLDIPVSLGMNTFLLRTNENLNNVFAYYLLKSPLGKIEIAKRVKGAVTKTIRKDSIREIPILIPPIDEQTLFSQHIEKIKKEELTAQKSMLKSNELFKSLLQQAFKGELTQTESAN